ncbi:MAG: hypothetical protein DRP87_01110 [Spirochaetes bacterium]|nr:MAG: hypothetical protein DRP87_01110 [Spirochaetota bacterium]
MEFKIKIWTLSSLLALLIAVYVIGTVFSYQSIQKRQEEQPLLPGIKLTDVFSFEIKAGKESVSVNRNTDGSWSVIIEGRAFPAESTRIENFLSNVLNLKKFREITRNRENWKDFDLSPESAKKLILKNEEGEKVTEFMVGKRAIHGEGDYVRVEGDDTVYMTDSTVAFYLNQGTAYWSHLSVMPEELTGEEIDSIHLEWRDEGQWGRYLLVRREGEQMDKWVIEGKEEKELDQTKVDSLANSIATLRGAKFIPDPDNTDTGLDSPMLILVVTTGGGNRYELSVGRVGDGEEKSYFLKRADIPFVYELEEWSLKRINKKLEDLLK